jgi:hypothetical protein
MDHLKFHLISESEGGREKKKERKKEKRERERERKKRNGINESEEAKRR